MCVQVNLLTLNNNNHTDNIIKGSPVNPHVDQVHQLLNNYDPHHHSNLR